ncbi:MAG: ABC transporter permease [Candidatus Eremiobacteraeota bacterium]|nr:ABC transporter permease [Candidatus Eremiobacteraeota bacterium]
MSGELVHQALVHAWLCALALGAAGLAGIPLGVLAAEFAAARNVVLPLANIARVVPPLAVLTFVLPFLGVGTPAAVVALILLAIPPIVIATDLGFRNVPTAIREAAAAMGMQRQQSLARVEWPLAAPIVFSGLRTAAVEVVASATIASFIGAGGLGVAIQQGLSTNQPGILWPAVAIVAVLAFAAQGIFAAANRSFKEAQ